MTHKLSTAWTFVTLMALPLFIATPHVEARSDSSNSGRLALIERATGGSSSSSRSTGSFSAHVDAILNRRAEPARSAANTLTSQEPILVSGPEQDLSLIEPARPSTAREDRRENLNLSEEAAYDESIDSRMKLDDYHYQESLKEAYEEDEDNYYSQRKETDLSTRVYEDESLGVQSNLRPSLANNPFYFSQEANDFDQTKIGMIARLIQEGYTKSEAQAVFQNVGSRQEAVLKLMREEGYDYGEAVQIAG